MILHRRLAIAAFAASSAAAFAADAEPAGDLPVRELRLPNFESRIEFSPPGAPSFYYIDDSKARQRIREKDDRGRLRMWDLFEFRAPEPE